MNQWLKRLVAETVENTLINVNHKFGLFFLECFLLTSAVTVRSHVTFTFLSTSMFASKLNGPVTPAIYPAFAIARTISCIVITIVGPIASLNAPT